MTALGFWTVFSLSIWFFKPAGAGRGGTWGAVHCRDDQYLSGNICCSNCPAGTHLLAPCSGAGRRGACKECEDGTFTEHTNSLRQCLKCTQCRADQDVVRACSHTLNAECRCKPGRFCAPDQACEVCRKCSRCDEDEEVARNCTPTANTECKKVQVKSASVKTAVIVLLSLLAAAVIVSAFVCVWKRRRSTGSRGNPSDALRAEKPHGDGPPAEEGRNGGRLIPTRPAVRAKPSVCVEDERRRLCESLSSSASNSQHSLTSPNACSSPTPPATREDEAFPQLVAVNGERSLRECFHYFEEIDVDYHKRFFRHLGVRDNAIKGRDHLPYEDKIHDLLGDWLEKEGQEASLNRLLGALLDLNQRRTAENIKEKAVQQGHYVCED